MIVLICVSLMAGDVEHLFVRLFTTQIFSSVKYVSMSFVHFIIGVCTFTVEFCEFFIYSKYDSFDRHVVCKYFVPVCILFLHLLTGSFTDQTFNGLAKSNYNFFLL